MEDFPSFLKALEITKKFSDPTDHELIKGISLEVKSGESIAIMGRSGEGKSTLLNILGTLDEPTTGELFIKGKKVDKNSAPLLRNQHIGFVFQSFNLLEDYTVLQNVLLPAFIGGSDIRKGSKAYERAVLLLEEVELGARIGYTTKLLSGGEKQRVALARALCNDPELILADEPSGNLDQTTSCKIHDLLLATAHKHQKALIIVTHNQELASLCQKTYHLKSGKLIS